MLEALSKKQKFIFFIILFIMISVIIYYLYFSIYSTNFNLEEENINLFENTLVEDISSENTLNKEENNLIVVYICGAVKNSKVITLDENSRICDAIEAVGGLNEDADLTNINLAYILHDGEKIYIPKIGEEIQDINNISSYSEKTNKININKATQTELETIPGVGPSTALKIIEYRNKNGNFSSIEDIKNISGIGDKKFENIKNYISIK